MDRIDKKIITLLQKNARMPLKALAEQVFLSSPAVSARIERLEKEQIISGYEAKVNPFKLGYHITEFINLDVMPTQKPGASTATISRVNRSLNYGNDAYDMVFERLNIKNEEQ